MKAFKHLILSGAPVVMLAMLAVSLTSCTDDIVGSQVDESGTPEITGVRFVDPTMPREVDKIGPGDWVALLGRNMDATTHVYFDGIQASFNPALMTDTSLVVMVPSDMPFGSMDPDAPEMNTIKVENARGSSVLDFPVVPPPPVVTTTSYSVATGRTSFSANRRTSLRSCSCSSDSAKSIVNH